MSPMRNQLNQRLVRELVWGSCMVLLHPRVGMSRGLWHRRLAFHSVAVWVWLRAFKARVRQWNRETSQLMCLVDVYSERFGLGCICPNTQQYWQSTFMSSIYWGKVDNKKPKKYIYIYMINVYTFIYLKFAPTHITYTYIVYTSAPEAMVVATPYSETTTKELKPCRWKDSLLWRYSCAPGTQSYALSCFLLGSGAQMSWKTKVVLFWLAKKGAKGWDALKNKMCKWFFGASAVSVQCSAVDRGTYTTSVSWTPPCLYVHTCKPSHLIRTDRYLHPQNAMIFGGIPHHHHQRTLYPPGCE